MTTRKNTLSPLQWSLFIPLIAIAIFAVLLFAVRPTEANPFGTPAQQVTYLLVRIGVLIGVAFGLAKYGQRGRLYTMTTTVLVGFVEQVILKGIGLRSIILARPQEWQGFEPTTFGVFYGLAQVYMTFVPIVLILAFLGMEATRFRRDWSLKS